MGALQLSALDYHRRDCFGQARDLASFCGVCLQGGSQGIRWKVDEAIGALQAPACLV